MKRRSGGALGFRPRAGRVENKSRKINCSEILLREFAKRELMQKRIALDELIDEELLTETEKLVMDERRLLLDVLQHLREIQKRKLFSEIGYTSLHDYAVRHLKYSDDQAARRIAAMRLLTELPVLAPKVERGELSLTTMAMASRFFKEEEKSIEMSQERKIEVIEGIVGLSTREAERKLIASSVDPVAYRARVVESVRPVSNTENEVRIVLTDDVLEKINTLRGLLSHKRPGISISELISDLCDFAIEEWDPARSPRRKMARSDGGTLATEMRRPTASMKRLLFDQSGGQCERCGSRFFLEMDHIKPWRYGGKTTPDNLRVLCRNCNQRRNLTGEV